MTVAIEAASLTKQYRGGVTALDGLSFQVEAGSIFGLLGPNGAGKSTAVKILTTLTTPDGGSASVAGIDVLAHPEKVRQVIGVVGQRAGVDPEATGRENLQLQGHLHGMHGRELKQRVDDLLERFGLADAGDRIVRGYSGGMERRLDVATGLVHRPQVLFLDEPTTGLDPEVRSDMWAEIQRLAGEERMTILLTTHYLEEADRLASRLGIVDRGRIVTEGTPNALKDELRGDALYIELGGHSNGKAVNALSDLREVREVILEGQALRARADDGAAAVPLVLDLLKKNRVDVAAVTVKRPSLDDVYLRYTGRSFDQAEAQAVEVKR